jgi:hypothetical protein
LLRHTAQLGRNGDPGKLSDDTRPPQVTLNSRLAAQCEPVSSVPDTADHDTVAASANLDALSDASVGSRSIGHLAMGRIRGLLRSMPGAASFSAETPQAIVERVGADTAGCLRQERVSKQRTETQQGSLYCSVHARSCAVCSPSGCGCGPLENNIKGRHLKSLDQRATGLPSQRRGSAVCVSSPGSGLARLGCAAGSEDLSRPESVAVSPGASAPSSGSAINADAASAQAARKIARRRLPFIVDSYQLGFPYSGNGFPPDFLLYFPEEM